ncbi:type II toxin-antitoxin system VapC family toxin [Caldinitratiruptor microaerophilus]|uniref:PIN domain-containing protein n=1 Tax=Caldinitratiruptor microaerophilus TaxID=671077 RepID=A0AA35CJK6_9FIRM|nr:type II toxin-antitoxin system VapC family toxin [Caldinitratiruptor microaerophilus]BDG60494.1 hypothetical protein caldi_15840 [Caldinitratiruptor microaerophilus]
MSKWVLDASALLALLNNEPGAEQVMAALLEGAVISAVNLSEVTAKLADVGMPEAEIRQVLGPLPMDVVPFDAESAYQTGLLRVHTREAGLSLGDRACLALAKQLGRPALTAERAWGQLKSDVEVRLIR